MKKLLGCLLALALLPAGVFAGETTIAPDNTFQLSEHNRSGNSDVYLIPLYGTITALDEFNYNPGDVIHLTDENGNSFRFIYTLNTFIPEDLALTTGMTVAGFYSSDIPVNSESPAYPVRAIGPMDASTGASVKVDYFDASLLSADGSLILSIGKETMVTDQLGNPFTEAPGNNTLMVYYDVVLESYPAQTTPRKIVVLADRMNGLPPTAPGAVNTGGQQVYVNGSILETVTAIMYGEDGALAPLRPICEALGYEVHWSTSGVAQVLDLTLDFSQGTYTNAGNQTDGEALLLDGVTYVPVHFFRQYLNCTLEMDQSTLSITGNEPVN